MDFPFKVYSFAFRRYGVKGAETSAVLLDPLMVYSTYGSPLAVRRLLVTCLRRWHTNGDINSGVILGVKLRET